MTVRESAEGDNETVEQPDLVQVLQAAQERAAEVEGQITAYESEIAALDASLTAERCLDDPEGAAESTERIDALGRRIGLARHALELARVRVTAARSSVLLAEAEALRGPVSVAQAAVLAHDKQTAKLQAAVERHTGQRMLLQPKTVDPSEHHRLGELGVPWLPSVRERLEGEVERRQRLVDAVVAAAEGMPVELRWDELPDVLKPGGVGDLGWGPPIGQDAAREAERARIEPLARHAESAYRRYVAAVCDYYAEKRSRSVGAAFKDLEPLRRMAEQAASSYRKAAAAVPGTFHDCQLPAAWPVDSHEAAALTLESAGAQ